MAGTRGPVPKRSAERRRRNKGEAITKAPGAPAKAPAKPRASRAKAKPAEAAPGAIPVPRAPANLHPIAGNWFRSLGESGQRVFYEPSDWALAAFVAEAMSRLLKETRLSAVGFAAVMSATADLLTSEGARRRVRIELERQGPAEDAAVSSNVTSLVAVMAKLRRDG